MTIQNREPFLDRLAQRLGQPRHQLSEHPYQQLNDLPQQTLSTKTPAELLTIARKNSEALPVTFHEVSLAALPQLLTDYVAYQGGGPLLLPTTEQFVNYQLTAWQTAIAAKQQVNYWRPDADRATNLKAAEIANISISFADFLLAESGTITVSSHPGQGRALHFLPTHYLSIVPRSRIVARSTQAIAWYQQEQAADRLTSSAIHFITGPSNSGDIEMQLVTGVHGPLDVTYVVVAD
ncbi:LutC/YkgG family protein [Loigolactobacillus binensis]|uniref:Lactate utilization protein C n=1 Tax=Loigolactobacillus binensis TaxID=2559922 RepID=A0ABW3EHD2_9LACO|nr:lactate utilization protein C [Loigolactobacillus binensis]